MELKKEIIKINSKEMKTVRGDGKNKARLQSTHFARGSEKRNLSPKKLRKRTFRQGNQGNKFHCST